MRTLRAAGVRGFSFYGRPAWTVHRREVDGLELRCFVAAEHQEWAPKLLDAMADSIAFYRELFGSYPTRNLDLITIWGERGGGAFACCNVMGIFLGPGSEGRYRWLVAHEVAHQYFGNLVNQTRHELYWVLIGLGMVFDRRYLLDRGLDDQALRQTLGMYRRAKEQGHNTTLSQTAAALLATEPPWSYQWNLVLGHAKAYSVCSMLEDLVGKERFTEVVRDLLGAKAGGMITPAELVRRCEEASGEALGWFVADWIDGDVSLDYGLGAVRRKGEVWQVEVKRLGQAAYPVLVEAETVSGTKLRARVARDRETDFVTFATDEQLVAVTVDPERIYPDLVPDNDRWQR